jgi:hypothetical protein
MRISWGYWNDFCDRLPIGEINREIDANFGIGTLERDVFSSSHHPALGLLLRVIFSENRCPLFGITR